VGTVFVARLKPCPSGVVSWTRRAEKRLLGRCAAGVVGTLGASSAIRAFGNALSILALALAAASGLSRRYTVRVLVSSSTFACIWVVGSSRLTIATDSLAARILGTIRLA
jgi:hypothetical protein